MCKVICVKGICWILGSLAVIVMGKASDSECGQCMLG